MNDTPAGWYPDPQNQAFVRWWDGVAWSAETSPLPSTTMPQPAVTQPFAPAATTSPAGLTGSKAALISMAGFALAALGSLLPWATVRTGFGSVSVNGTDGDGVLTLVLSLVGAGLMFAAYSGKARKLNGILSIVAALLVAMTGIYDATNISSSFSGGGGIGVSVGIGLYLVIIGALVAGFFATNMLGKRE